MKIKEIENLVEKAAESFVTKNEAVYFAKECMETHIKKSPRTNPLKEVVSDLENWDKSKIKKVTTVVDLPGMIKINFNGLAPSLKIKLIHDTLEKKARKNGIAIAAIVNSQGMHTMHLWTQGLAKRGLFALASFNGGPAAVVPFNGTKGLLGTNPLSYAFPTKNDMVIVDFATSEIPFFQIIDAKKNNKKLPNNAAVDSEGRETTDPNKAIDQKEISNLLPMGGGYKGYALNYLLEIMTGALLGSKLSTEMSLNYSAPEHGGFLIAINIDSLNKTTSFKSSVSKMNDIIRAQKPKKGNKIIVPGDNNIKRYKNKDKSFDVDGKTLEKLKKLTKTK
jgi:LDH2 family malate/lactate/ureidoglycolate dehydrogenase